MLLAVDEEQRSLGLRPFLEFEGMALHDTGVWGVSCFSVTDICSDQLFLV